jgi:uncharacterized protein with HEPN domain
MSSKDKASLLAILDSIERINAYVSSVSTAGDYYHSNVIFDATLMNFITIGEMVARVSKDLKDKHNDLDWQKMKDFRNLVAHDYLGVDAEEVWQIIKNDLPPLRERLNGILLELK